MAPCSGQFSGLSTSSLRQGRDDSRWATYTTVCAVRPPALLGGLIDLDMLNDQVASVKALGIGIGLGVLEKAENELCGLDGPPGLGDTKLLAYSPRRNPSVNVLGM